MSKEFGFAFRGPHEMVQSATVLIHQNCGGPEKLSRFTLESARDRHCVYRCGQCGTVVHVDTTGNVHDRLDMGG